MVRWIIKHQHERNTVTDHNLTAAVTRSLLMKPGDVALVMEAGEEGGFSIVHNIESIERTGMIQGDNGDAEGILMALAFTDIMANDEAAMFAALRRVSAKLSGGNLKLV